MRPVVSTVNESGDTVNATVGAWADVTVTWSPPGGLPITSESPESASSRTALCVATVSSMKFTRV